MKLKSMKITIIKTINITHSKVAMKRAEQKQNQKKTRERRFTDQANRVINLLFASLVLNFFVLIFIHSNELISFSIYSFKATEFLVI